jgi:hypothetical protein
MAKGNFRQLFQLIAIPLAMTGFVLIASQVGGFVLRTDQPVKIDSSLATPIKNPPG